MWGLPRCGEHCHDTTRGGYHDVVWRGYYHRATHFPRMCKSVHYKQTHNITNTGQIRNPISPCSDPEHKNPKTINLSLPQPTPHLTTSTTCFLIMTISTQSAPDRTTDSHVNLSPTRQQIDRMWMSVEHTTMPDAACYLHGLEPPLYTFHFQ